MLLLSPHACCFQAQLAPLHKVPLGTFSRARFAFHSIGTKHPSVLLSVLCLNTKENMFITMLTFPKISDFKHSNKRRTVRRETPLSGLQSYYLSWKSWQTMQKKCSYIFVATEKTKAWTEYLPQYGTITADCQDFTVDPQDHAYTGRLKAG